MHPDHDGMSVFMMVGESNCVFHAGNIISPVHKKNSLIWIFQFNEILS